MTFLLVSVDPDRSLFLASLVIFHRRSLWQCQPQWVINLPLTFVEIPKAEKFRRSFTIGQAANIETFQNKRVKVNESNK
jgi:hypothetical protein